MNILVYDVAAENGGAVTILEYYYGIHSSDVNNHYYYLLSTYKLADRNNITVINVPSIKKSWLHRLAFDYFESRKFLKQYKIDEVFSLQNTILPSFRGKQTVYLHNAIPFSEVRFHLYDKPFLWVYQNIVGYFIKRSCKSADEVIVQTQWMRNEVEKITPETKITISFPEISIPNGIEYKKSDEVIFFYPANPAHFKNHKVLIDACTFLRAQNINNYRVVLTLTGNENNEIAALYQRSIKLHLPVKWIGTVSRNEVFDWYQKSVLVFPSYLETVGLPLYEAKKVKCPIIAADCKYAKDVIGDYSDAYFFDYCDSSHLAELMREFT